MDNKKTHINRNSLFKLAFWFSIVMLILSVFLDSGYFNSPLDVIIFTIYFFGVGGIGLYRVITGKSCKCPNCKHKGLQVQRLFETINGFRFNTYIYKCPQCGGEFKEKLI